MAKQLFHQNLPLEKSFFFIPRICLSFLGYWPNQTLGFLLIIRICLNYVLLFFATFSQIVFGFINIADLLLALDAFCPALTEVVTLIKLLAFVYYRNNLKLCIIKLYKIMKELTKNKDGFEIYNRLHYRATIIAGGILCFSNLTNFSYGLRPLLNGAIMYYKSENVTIDMPFRVQIPVFLTELPYLPFVYVSVWYTGLVTVFGFSGVDGFLVAYCHYISAMFKTIQLETKAIFSCLENKNFASEEDSVIFRKKLKEVVILQNKLNKICKSFTKIYTSVIISHFFSSAAIIGLSVLDMLTNTGFGIVLYICYSAAVLAQLLTYCEGGSIVIQSSLDIATSLYNVEWYKCNKPIQKTVLLIIMRAQQPITIAVPFFSPSMELFGTVLSSVGSYVTLLKTFL
ncbi:odorant receptor 10a-like [Condylostylus longicornis]|uniref:odorant receptor 10a-like n=1 Tax=Condylostylus longicornis TaxID=2530218 RepID=UPI00244E3029|nr:odorant receptor 10a-like [Condylostylus longicornis]